jgi:BolA protein
MTDRLLTIKLRLQEALCPSQLDVIDESYKHVGHSGAQGGAGHFVISIASTVFAGKKKLECHRLIYAVLSDMIPHEIHALQIKIIP